MKRPGLRFQVRWLMVGVAVVGWGLGWWRECQGRRERYRRAACRHEVNAAAAQHRLNGADRLRDPDWSEHCKAEVAYGAMLAAKYRRASASPWFGVAPDPPPPVAP